MRHLKRTNKLGRKGDHRNAMLANLVCSLIKHKRVTTTVPKAKAARSVAEKLVTLGKSGTLHDRRLAAARLHQEDAVKTSSRSSSGLKNSLRPSPRRKKRRPRKRTKKTKSKISVTDSQSPIARAIGLFVSCTTRNRFSRV
jgi:ribosomal protein L17